jgi:hypothetical protein
MYSFSRLLGYILDFRHSSVVIIVRTEIPDNLHYDSLFYKSKSYNELCIAAQYYSSQITQPLRRTYRKLVFVEILMINRGIFEETQIVKQSEIYFK